jgi:hypothetical protein
MHIDIPFKGSSSETVTRVKRTIDEARPQIAEKATIYEERWEGNTLHFDVSAQGQRVSGTLAIGDSEMVLDAKLPLMLRLFEGRIQKEIEGQIAQMAK